MTDTHQFDTEINKILRSNDTVEMGGCSSAPEDEETPVANRRTERKTSETNSVDLIARKVEMYLDFLSGGKKLWEVRVQDQFV